jgi:hypothetical protein
VISSRTADPGQALCKFLFVDKTGMNDYKGTYQKLRMADINRFR